MRMRRSIQCVQHRLGDLDGGGQAARMAGLPGANSIHLLLL